METRINSSNGKIFHASNFLVEADTDVHPANAGLQPRQVMSDEGRRFRSKARLVCRTALPSQPW